MKKFLILAAFVSCSAWATTFAPIPFEKQLREADGAIEGKFLGTATIKNSDDEVFTQATFLVKRSIGFNQGQIANNQRVVVTYPGGLWQGINYSVPGSPKFKQGEEVFLILRKTDRGYALNNFALGKYTIHQDGAEKHLVSEVFPQHPDLGEISYSQMEHIIHRVFQTALDESGSDRNIHMVADQMTPTSAKTSMATRAPASIDSDSQEPKPQGMRTGFWLGLLFGILGIFSVWFARQRH